jgi:hypothetical protein
VAGQVCTAPAQHAGPLWNGIGDVRRSCTSTLGNVLAALGLQWRRAHPISVSSNCMRMSPFRSTLLVGHVGSTRLQQP